VRFLQSFFGFGQGAETEIVLDNVDSRRMAEVKGEDGKKEKHFLFYDGETVSGKVRRLIINAYIIDTDSLLSVIGRSSQFYFSSLLFLKFSVSAVLNVD